MHRRARASSLAIAVVACLAWAPARATPVAPEPPRPAIAATGRATPADTVATPRCADADAPDAVVCRFYRRYLELRPPGLLTPAEQTEFAPLLSLRLRRALDAARLEQTRFIRRHPGEKPPFVDGCLFASLFEGPRRFTIAGVTGAPDGGARVSVRFEYDARTRWQDVVVVRRERDRYVIDDVIRSGVGDFDPPGRLSEILRQREE